MAHKPDPAVAAAEKLIAKQIERRGEELRALQLRRRRLLRKAQAGKYQESRPTGRDAEELRQVEHQIRRLQGVSKDRLGRPRDTDTPRRDAYALSMRLADGEKWSVVAARLRDAGMQAISASDGARLLEAIRRVFEVRQRTAAPRAHVPKRELERAREFDRRAAAAALYLTDEARSKLKREG